MPAARGPLALSVSILLTLLQPTPASSDPALTFERTTIVETAPDDPHSKTVADVDGDGRVDVIAASHSGQGMYWYKNPGAAGGAWTTTTMVPPAANQWFTTDMQAADVDGDGDVDVIVPTDNRQFWNPNRPPQSNVAEVRWYENPRVGGGTRWEAHSIGADGRYAHDVEVADLDGDGLVDVVTRQPGSIGGATFVWLQRRADGTIGWTKVRAADVRGEGIALGDVDGDGLVDIAGNGYWVRNLGGGTTWSRPRAVTDGRDGAGDLAYVGVLIVDVDGDAKNDVVMAASEADGTAANRLGLTWYKPTATDADGPTAWAPTVIDATTSHLHTFKAADMDRDGDLDLITAEMNTSQERRVGVYRNPGPGGGSWAFDRADDIGAHNIRVADVDGDGHLDIVGANFRTTDNTCATAGCRAQITEAKGIHVWRTSAGGTALDRWGRQQLDPERQAAPGERALFVRSGDLDGDGRPDVVAGRSWYAQKDDGTFTTRAVGGTFKNVAAVFDLDDDGDLDLVGTKGGGSEANNEVVWAQNDGTGRFRIYDVGGGDAMVGDGDFLQGIAIGRFEGGDLGVALSWHAHLRGGSGVYLLAVPPDLRTTPTAPWSGRRISPTTQNEELSAGDIDRDGRPDLMLGTKWLRNPGPGGDDWPTFTLFTPTGPNRSPDRNRLADIDGDGRLDAVVGFEATNTGRYDAETTRTAPIAWYQQPADPTAPWEQHVVRADAVGPMSLDVADMDRDGALDIVVGEHDRRTGIPAGKGPRLEVFEHVTDAEGVIGWRPHLVHRGDEHHDGAQVVDIDRDADLDIISVGFDSPGPILYTNEASSPAPAPLLQHR